MKKLVLIKVTILNFNVEDLFEEFPSLRIYLCKFPRLTDGSFLSEAEVSESTIIRDSISLRNSLLDWSFNEIEASDFFKRNPDGFQFECHKLDI